MFLLVLYLAPGFYLIVLMRSDLLKVLAFFMYFCFVVFVLVLWIVSNVVCVSGLSILDCLVFCNVYRLKKRMDLINIIPMCDVKVFLTFTFTEYGTVLTTILPILFLYLNTVIVTAGDFEL